jgi:diguanylate cyclase (GGDEF)-like protein
MAIIPAVPFASNDRVSFEQALMLANIMRFLAFIGTNTALVLLADFALTNLPVVSRYTFVLVIGCYLIMFIRCRTWLVDENSRPSSKRFIDEIQTLSGLVSTLWGVAFINLTGVASPAQLSLIYGIIVACLSMPALVAPVSVSIAAWAPVTILGFISLMIRKSTFDPFALVAFAGYAGLTGFCILYLNRRLIERVLDTIRIEENAELIKLLLRDFEENASDWLWETDSALQLQRVSPRLAQVARRPAETITGTFPHALIGEMSRFDPKGASAVSRLNRLIADRSAFRDLVIPVIIGGEERSWLLTGKPILDNAGNFIGYHGVGADITSARRSQEQIAFLARHDSLTRLPNRVLFNEVLHNAYIGCKEESIALLCLDLDDFKVINDTLGHATGDALLVAVGERIKGCIRDNDTAARLGGDEFAIILAGRTIAEISAVATRLVDRIGRPYHFDGQVVEIGVSIGIGLAPKDSKTPNELLKHADLALYRAKADGRSRWRLYDSEMDERLQERRSLQADLRQALLRGEFKLYFQPIIDLSANRMIGAEALLRWSHPRRGELAPTEFVPLAEDAGLIAPIGAWVLRQACLVAAGWPDSVRIAVNISPVQFRDAGLMASVDESLSSSGLDPARLELEITETTVLETNSQTVDALWKLHGRGVRIALDDFGTGYSSLSYLRRFPFDKIKIDRSFIQDLGHEKDDSSIILAIIGLADSMNMVVTAEGVETNEQAALLRSYGCAQAQGYLFCRPVTAEVIQDFIAAYTNPLAPQYSSAAQ